MKALEILAIDGIVIRKIPVVSVSRWSYREGDENHLNEGETIVTNESGRKVRQVEKKNALSGYAITLEPSQGATVMFYKKTSGFGSTVEEAYADFIAKNT